MYMEIGHHISLPAQSAVAGIKSMGTISRQQERI